jgi:hypothetical protein
MCQLPTWVQYLTAFGTPIIALMVAAIAFAQWRTAHQRVVLDLFERRMTIIDGLLRIVAEVRQAGKVRNEDSDRFNWATKGAEFLFRPKVTEYLDRIHGVLVQLHPIDVQLEGAKGPKWDELSEKREALRKELWDFSSTFRKLVGPYVQMHQKLLWF